MPISRSNEDLPRASTTSNKPVAPEHQLIARHAADAWWIAYQASEDFTRDRAMPELPLRASSISKRCDRQLFYDLAEVPKTDPSGAAGTYRMMLGTKVHEALPTPEGWTTEDVIDLRPAGFPGSAHGDLVKRRDDGTVFAVGEVKTVGGYAFKLMTSNFNGPPEGPRWDHVMQAAMAAVALDAELVVIIYFSMEPLSPAIAKSVGADEYGKFTAEWQIPVDEAMRTEVEREARRQIRILKLAELGARPERTLSHPDIPAGAMVDNPNRGSWIQLNIQGQVIKSNTTWYCGYCDWKTQCLEDGPDAIPVTVSRLASVDRENSEHNFE